MSLYPKQLQYYTENSQAVGPGGTRIRNATYGEKVVYSDGFTPGSNVTVNDLVSFVIPSEIYGIDLTGITGNARTRPEHRKLDTEFGETVVFPGGVPISGAKSANEIIAICRALWDNYNVRSVNSTGLATSVQN